MSQPDSNLPENAHTCPFCASTLMKDAGTCPSCNATREFNGKQVQTIRIAILVTPFIYAAVAYFVQSTMEPDVFKIFIYALVAVSLVDVGIFFYLGRNLKHGYTWKRAK